MKVIWQPLAKKALHDRARYIRKMHGKQVRDEFMHEAHETARMLGRNPDAGKVEPLLENRPEGFRSFVMNRINKIVYRITDDRIEIVDFWDVRREPDTLADSVK